ncbi:MAG: prepilin peptidase [Chitinispirillales bacterium]|jgi:leader peptidase (prepilin peptidase)/N-methyltransferase|nr:prepilin peptidase [Chitinispirillales bacterium]
MDIIHIAILAAAGLCAGSFFNVLIYRIPRAESIAWPGSHCTACGYKIKAYENIPVLSYIFLRGKCSGCKAPISIIYPLVEILTAAALVLIWKFSGVTFASSLPWYQNIVPLLKIVSLILLIPISVIDIRHYIIPDRFTLPFLALSLALSFIPGGLSPVQSFLGALCGGGSLLLLGIIGTYVLKKGDAMGMGDVKLMAYLGALWGAKTALIGIAFGALLGSIIGGLLILSKNIGNEEHRIPFGPFLAAGTIASVYWGDTLLQAYLRLIGM